MSADLQREGTVPLENDALEIDEIGALTDLALVFSSQFEISSGPMAFCTLILESAA